MSLSVWFLKKRCILLWMDGWMDGCFACQVRAFMTHLAVCHTVVPEPVEGTDEVRVSEHTCRVTHARGVAWRGVAWGGVGCRGGAWHGVAAWCGDGEAGLCGNHCKWQHIHLLFLADRLAKLTNEQTNK